MELTPPVVVEVDGHPVRVRASGAAEADELVGSTAARMMELLVACADELIDDLNDDWLRDGAPPVDRETFYASLVLVEIAEAPGGARTWTFLDGGLFWGHGIVVRADPAGAITEVLLVG